MKLASCKSAESLRTQYSLTEKIIMRFSYYGSLCIGAYAIFLRNKFGGLVYALLSVIANIIVISSLCTHCPYPYKYSSCAFGPYTWVTKNFTYRDKPLSAFEMGISALMFLFLVFTPQYWLKKTKLLKVFWLTLAPALTHPVLYCRSCSNFGCPLNLVDEAIKSQASE